MKVLVAICLGICFFSLASAWNGTSPLINYVRAPDPYYNYIVSSNVTKELGFTIYNLYLTSQQWLNASVASNSIWTHWVQLCIPNYYQESQAFLWIGDGTTAAFDQPPSDFGEFGLLTNLICEVSQSVVGYIRAIPNEPITFYGDWQKKSRMEDAVIAYTWAHMINYTTDYNWLARFPMTKACIKAMDAIQDFALKQAGITISKFVVSGASKRGWTAWMVGAVQDPRVSGIIPIVAPVGNIIPQFNEQYQSYNGFSFAIADYADQHLLPGWLNTNEIVDNVLQYIDPLNYPEAMAAIPKYVIVASQDEFFMPDAAQYYWNSLPGEKYLWIVENADHALFLNIVEVVTSITEFYLSTFNERHLRPTYYWNITNNGQTITFVDTSLKGNIVAATVWMNQNNPNRDWRFITCPDVTECLNLNAYFEPLTLNPVQPGVYQFTLEQPIPNHYSAFFIEVQYEIVDEVMRVSSDMSILPQGKYPFPPCGAECTCKWNCTYSQPSSK